MGEGAKIEWKRVARETGELRGRWGERERKGLAGDKGGRDRTRGRRRWREEEGRKKRDKNWQLTEAAC